jgi:dUTP pyrophosphatase
MNLNIKKLSENIVLPSYGSAFAAGLDVSSSDDYVVLPRSRIVVSTGISVSWNGEDCNNYYLRVAPRSGLSVKNNIDIGAGVIDCDYRGEIKVCFINNDNEKDDDSKLEKSTDDAEKKPISETTKSIYRSTIFPN